MVSAFIVCVLPSVTFLVKLFAAINDPKLNISDIIKDPIKIISKYKKIPNPQIPLPSEIYLPQRKNAKGYDVDNEITRLNMINLFNSFNNSLKGISIVKGKETEDEFHKVYNPANLDQLLGQVAFANDQSINQSIHVANSYFPYWKRKCFHNKPSQRNLF